MKQLARAGCWLAAAALAVALVACSGSDSASGTAISPSQLRQQDAVVDTALCASITDSTTWVRGQCLRTYNGLAASQRAQVRQLASVLPFTASTLMDWAQATFPTLFPGTQADQAGAGFVYRFYPQTQTFIAVAGDLVYVLGPVTGTLLYRLSPSLPYLLVGGLLLGLSLAVGLRRRDAGADAPVRAAP